MSFWCFRQPLLLVIVVWLIRSAVQGSLSLINSDIIGSIVIGSGVGTSACVGTSASSSARAHARVGVCAGGGSVWFPRETSATQVAVDCLSS